MYEPVFTYEVRWMVIYFQSRLGQDMWQEGTVILFCWRSIKLETSLLEIHENMFPIPYWINFPI